MWAVTHQQQCSTARVCAWSQERVGGHPAGMGAITSLAGSPSFSSAGRLSHTPAGDFQPPYFPPPYNPTAAADQFQLHHVNPSDVAYQLGTQLQHHSYPAVARREADTAAVSVSTHSPGRTPFQHPHLFTPECIRGFSS